MSAIDPKDIRVGDRVRQTWRYEDGSFIANEYTVTNVDAKYIWSSHHAASVRAEYDWELLDRPVPDLPVGTIVSHDRRLALKTQDEWVWLTADGTAPSVLRYDFFATCPVIYSPEAAS